jgi:electron transfer flavoprotein beta subunit
MEMNIITPIKLVPDLVEELEIADDGKSLDMTFMRMILNELDEHAVEQAILLKERSGGHVTVIAPEVEGADDALFSAAAKGADRIIRITGDFENGVNNHALARLFASILGELQPDLIVTGVQAHNDLDGSVGPLLAGLLNMPYVGYVAGVTCTDGKCSVQKEYPGGLIAEMDVQMPAVIGIQAADQPPRYIAISRVRQAMKSTLIEEIPATDLDLSGGTQIERMFQPEVGERATMIEGDEKQVAAKLIEVLRELGAL